MNAISDTQNKTWCSDIFPSFGTRNFTKIPKARRMDPTTRSTMLNSCNQNEEKKLHTFVQQVTACLWLRRGCFKREGDCSYSLNDLMPLPLSRFQTGFTPWMMDDPVWMYYECFHTISLLFPFTLFIVFCYLLYMLAMLHYASMLSRIIVIEDPIANLIA